MSSRGPDRSDDVAALLAELQTTLDRLQSELDAEVDSGARRSRASTPPRTPPRPPSFGELLGFTEEYTIPTVVAVLEATIQSLELLRAVLRLADPSRSVGATASTEAMRLTGVAGRRATNRVERALSDLQTALSEADLPEDETARTLVDDARSLSADVERALTDVRDDAERRADDWRGRGDERRGRPDSQTGSVSIPVEDAATVEDADDEDAKGDAPAVDVEAELQSIKDEVEARDDGAGAAVAGGDKSEEAKDETDGETGDAPDGERD